MAATINIAAYSDALVVLGTAGVVVPMVRRWGLNPVLGYLGAGVVLGPFGLGSFIEQVPLLYWLTVVDAKNVAGIAELGVVFLLFLIGLELSYERLMTMRRLVVGLGGLQVVVSAAAIALVIGGAGQPAAVAIVLGSCLALSSTAIVLDVLSQYGRLTSATGRASFSVLLAQDIAVVPVLMLISVLGAGASGSVLGSLATALTQAAIALAIIVVVGRVMLRPLFRQVAATRSSELFIATILFVIVATGVIAALAGLSMALGAFVAGLLLAETEYRKSIEATIEPFKGLLLGIFFFTVGMGIDIRVILANPLLLVAAVAGMLVLKAAIVLTLGRMFGLSWPVTVESALLLGPGGEFAFVGIGLAASLGIFSADVAGFVLAVTSVSMAMIPALGILGTRLAARLTPPKPPDPALTVMPSPQAKHAIVIGFGRVGRVVSNLLAMNGVPHTIMDSDPITVADQRRQGREIYYGSGTDQAFMMACGLKDAAAVIITIHTKASIDEIVRQVRLVRPDILIVSRARDGDHARHLYEVGVSDAVPETIEASLQLSEAALVGLGVPTGAAIASIHEQRDIVRTDLQRAARKAGLEGSHAVKSSARGGG